MKIDKKYATILFGAFMSLGMSFTMSLALTIINLGFPPEFFEKWIRAFAIGYIVSFPTSLVIIPIVKKVVNKMTTQ